MTNEKRLGDALRVIVFDPKISGWLRTNDPQALKQACTALGIDVPPTPRAVCPYCHQPALVDLDDGSGYFSSACLEGNCV